MKMYKSVPEENQRAIESVYSKQNIRGIIKRAVEEESSGTLLNFWLAATLKVQTYLSTEYGYESKVRRVSELLESCSLESLVLGVASAVLVTESDENITYQQASGYLAATLPHKDVFNRVKSAAELLAVCSGLGLYDLVKGRPHLVVRKFNLDQETYGWVNSTGFEPPMVCKPKEVVSNRAAGYLDVQVPVILGGLEKVHDEKQALDVLNVLNQTVWELDEEVLSETEVSSKPLDTKEKFQNFLKQTRDSQVVYDLMLDHGNRFHLVNQYDSRGRCYQHAYPIHLQSYSYKKALLNFANREKLTEEGWFYLKVDVANQMGMDKENWDTRIDWVEQNWSRLESLDSLADEEVLYRKAVRALRAAEQGEAVGLPVGLDATASGLQMMAAMSGCRETAAAVNLIDTGSREDVYTEMARGMAQKVGKVVGRKDMKKPLMTFFYGSTAVPEQVFGTRSEALAAFYRTMEDKLDGAYELMQLFQSHWDSNAEYYQFTMPDGHVVKIPVMQTVEKKIEVDEFGHSSFMYRSKVVKPKRKGRSLAANITHSVDAWVLREMVRRANKQGFEMAVIHDCFFSHPNYLGLVRQNYREIMAELNQMDLVNVILGQLTGAYPDYQQKTVDLHKEILVSDYALS